MKYIESELLWKFKIVLSNNIDEFIIDGSWIFKGVLNTSTVFWNPHKNVKLVSRRILTPFYNMSLTVTARDRISGITDHRSEPVW